jgi:hypothetical protein
LQVVRTVLILVGLLAFGCNRPPANEAAATAQDAASAAERGYVAPPELLHVLLRPGDRLELDGSAQPGARVTLATPTGPAGSTVADASGTWRLIASTGAQARLLGLSMSNNDRVVQAKGYLFVAPDGLAARLRAGGGSEAFNGQPGALAVTAMDYDRQFAATLSGRAASGETVRLRVDGVERGQVNADPHGRFVLPLNEPLGAGVHDFELAGGRGEVPFQASIEAPASLSGAPFRAARVGAGWRIEWLTPGGGEQTTVVFAAARAQP